jgi:HEAT repeat protein
VRLSQWPRSAHDRTIRQLSSAPVEARAHLLVQLYDSLDPLIRPLAIDEMGMSGHHACIPKLLELAQDGTTPGFTRLKAIEAIGRLRATAASQLLQHMMEARQLWRYSYHDELRIAACARKVGAERA